MGADFSQVRIHTGSHVLGIGVVAYTQGNDIHFAPGSYQPHTDDGLRLIGHELAHVVRCLDAVTRGRSTYTPAHRNSTSPFVSSRAVLSSGEPAPDDSGFRSGFRPLRADK